MIRVLKRKIHIISSRPIQSIRNEILDNKNGIPFSEINLKNDKLYIYSELNNNKRSHFYSYYEGIIKETNHGTEITGQIYFLKFFEIGLWVLILFNLLFAIKYGHKALVIAPLFIIITLTTFLFFLSFEKTRYTKLIQKLISN